MRVRACMRSHTHTIKLILNVLRNLPSQLFSSCKAHLTSGHSIGSWGCYNFKTDKLFVAEHFRLFELLQAGGDGSRLKKWPKEFSLHRVQLLTAELLNLLVHLLHLAILNIKYIHVWPSGML